MEGENPTILKLICLHPDMQHLIIKSHALLFAPCKIFQANELSLHWNDMKRVELGYNERRRRRGSARGKRYSSTMEIKNRWSGVD